MKQSFQKEKKKFLIEEYKDFINYSKCHHYNVVLLPNTRIQVYRIDSKNNNIIVAINKDIEN